jgi:hypothetical protein
MSTFVRVSKHPQTGQYELATWIDDYFGPHIYGVLFNSDQKTYPTEMVDKAEVKNFFAADVKVAFLKYIEGQELDPHAELLKFLNGLEETYNERWDRDPLYGEGATMDDTEDDDDDYSD